MPSTPEPFSRILIDKALEASGWNLLDPRQVRFEVHAGGKRADYVLLDPIGRTLCVLEAKRADLDPYVLGVVENLMEGANLPCINQDNLLGIEIPLPPLNEQHRIVRILDEVEALRQLRARADERMVDFIPALFNQMFGDSTAQDSSWPKVKVTELCSSPDDIRCGPFGTQLQRHEYRPDGVPLWSIAHVNSHYSVTTNEYLSPEKGLLSKSIRCCRVIL